MAASMVFTKTVNGYITRVDCVWVSDDQGDSSGTSPFDLNGELIKGVTSVITTPTDDYDITLADSDGANPLALSIDDLADRDEANAETVHFLLSDQQMTPLAIAAYPVIAGPITVTVANAGDSTSGRLALYLKSS